MNDVVNFVSEYLIVIVVVAFVVADKIVQITPTPVDDILFTLIKKIIFTLLPNHPAVVMIGRVISHKNTQKKDGPSNKKERKKESDEQKKCDDGQKNHTVIIIISDNDKTGGAR